MPVIFKDIKSYVVYFIDKRRHAFSTYLALCPLTSRQAYMYVNLNISINPDEKKHTLTNIYFISNASISLINCKYLLLQRNMEKKLATNLQFLL